jgi:hypothetical protein
LVLAVTASLAGCWRTSEPAPVMAPTNPPEPKPTAPPPESTVAMVTSMVIVDACPESRKLDSKLATKEIDELVGPCKKVPGGAAHFSATLLPGGQVELAAPSGDTSEGVVPTCLLQQQKQLRHKLKIKTPCKFDVRLEERVAGQ